jgi:DNA-binding GntR family transcriptional regulator
MVGALRLRQRSVPFQGPRTRGDAIFDVLLDAIIKVDLSPGEILAKDAIARELGVSRTPVGDAINRLAALGLVSVVPQVGSFVSRISAQAVIESSFLRSAAEAEVVHRLASATNRKLVNALRDRLAEQGRFVAGGDVDTFHEADDDFHRFMVSEAGLPGVWEQIAAARFNLVRIRRLGLPQPGRLADAHAEHTRIVDEIEARRPRSAAKAMTEHIRYAEIYMKQLEREAPNFFV